MVWGLRLQLILLLGNTIQLITLTKETFRLGLAVSQWAEVPRMNVWLQRPGYYCAIGLDFIAHSDILIVTQFI